ncbi:hypothetical protein [Caballeronia sp. LZ043]|uniref:hypothetical protein n=1 Tax=Caballeronia sp. LZ043 TaxID=3038569 RepID=UPI00286B128D|nr:hypothetical protein [Caballeronia sp. LZ043]
MKISHIATIALLATSAGSSMVAATLVARQYTMQRPVVQLITDTAVVERMQGVSDAIRYAVDYMPVAERQTLVSDYGYYNEDAFRLALHAQRSALESLQRTRAKELAANDMRLTAVIAICGFNTIIALMSAVVLHDIASRRRRKFGEQSTSGAARRHTPA